MDALKSNNQASTSLSTKNVVHSIHKFTQITLHHPLCSTNSSPAPPSSYTQSRPWSPSPRSSQICEPRRASFTAGPDTPVQLSLPGIHPGPRLHSCPNESSYMYTVQSTISSTEQSYKYRMTYHLYRMSVLYLHARHSAVPYVHYGMNSGEVISVRPHWSPRPIQADQTSLTGGCRE